MIGRFLPLCLLAIGCLVSGWVHAEDKSVPAMAVVPDDAILVLRVAEPKTLIERASIHALSRSSSRCRPTRTRWRSRRRRKR